MVVVAMPGRGPLAVRERLRPDRRVSRDCRTDIAAVRLRGRAAREASSGDSPAVSAAAEFFFKLRVAEQDCRWAAVGTRAAEGCFAELTQQRFHLGQRQPVAGA